MPVRQCLLFLFCCSFYQQVQLRRNKATDGGGFYNYDGTTTFSGRVLMGKNGGGAFYLVGGSVTFSTPDQVAVWGNYVSTNPSNGEVRTFHNLTSKPREGSVLQSSSCVEARERKLLMSTK